MEDNILDVKNLTIEFNTNYGFKRVVNNVSFSVEKSKILGIVGESGCGKTVTSLSIVGLLPKRKKKKIEGEIIFQDNDLLKYKEKQLRGIRGNSISMIFQEPSTSLNPSMRVGKQISEVIKLHKNRLSNHEIKNEVIEILRKIRIVDPERVYYEYPHNLSGGMKQRIMIGMALACEPELLIADEPTTALDVTIQAQILELMNELQNITKTAIILISHDLGIIAEVVDKVVIMYAGIIVEEGDVFDVYDNPLHPYTKGLLSTIPKIEEDSHSKTLLNEIPGIVPDIIENRNCCPFAPRCDYAEQKCREIEPPVVYSKQNHFARCWFV